MPALQTARSPLPPHRALLTTHAALAHFADLFARAPLTPVRREWFCTPECLKEYRRLHMAWHIKRGRDPQFQLNLGKTMPEEEIEALLAGYAASLRAQQQFHSVVLISWHQINTSITSAARFTSAWRDRSCIRTQCSLLLLLRLAV